MERSVEIVLNDWRKKALQVLLVLAAVLGLPSLVNTVVNASQARGLTILGSMYILAYVGILALLALPRSDHRLRSWGLFLMIYMLAVTSFLRVGLAGSGRLYILSVPIFATILIGARAGYMTAGLSLLVYSGFAGLAQAGALEQWLQVSENPVSLSFWLEAGLALLAILFGIVILVARFHGLQLRTLIEERRSAAELQLAGEVQSGFLSDSQPEIEGWEIEFSLRPSRQTSGDFYDVTQLGDGTVGVLVADVVDKGVAAALFMALGWSLFRNYAQELSASPREVLQAVNTRVLKDTQSGQFMTAFFGVLDTQTGIMKYANAGHVPGLLLRSEQQQIPERLTNTGMPLGVQETDWGERTIELHPGDDLILYTDGLTEAESPSLGCLGEEGLQAILRRARRDSVAHFHASILSEVQSFLEGQEPQDDLVLGLIRRLTQPS
ncbi:MAG: PP2C family protein-serine/threonine phosphatase [Anaerolineales bacterium]|nr:PP2C family protein-serine/threonine phosphatase [Anaerolineales bacterium]